MEGGKFGGRRGEERPVGGLNALCGDRVVLYLKVDQGIIQDIGFQGSGCAISKASASIMTGALKGKTVEEAEALFQRFHDLVTVGPAERADVASLGKLASLSGVSEFPRRGKCARLA